MRNSFAPSFEKRKLNWISHLVNLESAETRFEIEGERFNLIVNLVSLTAIALSTGSNQMSSLHLKCFLLFIALLRLGESRSINDLPVNNFSLKFNFQCDQLK